MKKNMSLGNESCHEILTDKDLPQPSRHSIGIPAQENFNKTLEVECAAQTDSTYNNIYVENDVFDAFCKNYLDYKYDILHKIKKENIKENPKKIKSLENQIEYMKKENQVLKEILTSKVDTNNENNSNIDHTQNMVKANRGNNVSNNGNNRRFNSIDVRNKHQPIFIHENEVTEPRY